MWCSRWICGQLSWFRFHICLFACSSSLLMYVYNSAVCSTQLCMRNSSISCLQVCGQRCWKSLVCWQWLLMVLSLDCHQTLFHASSIVTVMARVLMEALTHSQSYFNWYKHLITHQWDIFTTSCQTLFTHFDLAIMACKFFDSYLPLTPIPQDAHTHKQKSLHMNPSGSLTECSEKTTSITSGWGTIISFSSCRWLGKQHFICMYLHVSFSIDPLRLCLSLLPPIRGCWAPSVFKKNVSII